MADRMDHRMQAAEFAGKQYYNQDPRLLRFVLSKPPDRVKYTISPGPPTISRRSSSSAREAEILKGRHHFEDYADPSFVATRRPSQPYDWEGPT